MMNGFETYRHNGWKGLVSREWRGRPDDLGKWLADHPGSVDRVVFNVFKDEDRLYYEELLG